MRLVRFFTILSVIGLMTAMLLPAMPAEAVSQVNDEKGNIHYSNGNSFYAEGLYWVFYATNADPSMLVYRTSSDGASWSSNTTLVPMDSPLGIDYSVYYDGTHVYVAVLNGDLGIDYRKGTPQSDGGISWLAAWQTALTVVDGAAWHISIVADADGCPWIAYQYMDMGGGTDTPYVSHTTSGDGTWTGGTGLGTALGSSIEGEYKHMLITRTGAYTLSVVCSDGSTIWQRGYDGESWLTAVTIATAEVLYFDLVRMTDGTAMTIYALSGYIKYAIYEIGSNSITSSGDVSNQFHIGTDGDNPIEWIGAAFDQDTGEVYVMGYKSGTTSQVIYSVYDGSWGSVTNWFTVPSGFTGQEIIKASDEGFIGATCTFNDNTYTYPYVFFEEIKLVETYMEEGSSDGPTVEAVTAPATVYANDWTYLNATVSDPNGTGDIEAVTVTLEDEVVIEWNTSREERFGIVSDPNGHATLDMVRCWRTYTAENVTFSWVIALDWTYPEGEIDVTAEARDTTDLTGEKAETPLFTFEDDLVISDGKVSDNHTRPGQGITFSGSVYYEGTSTAPGILDGITVNLTRDSEQVAYTTDIDADGGFSFAVIAPAAVGSYAYNISAFTDEISVACADLEVIVDRLLLDPITVDVVNDTVAMKVLWDYDDSAAEGTVMRFGGVNGAANATGWAVIDLSGSGTVQWLSGISVYSDAYGLALDQAYTVEYVKVEYASFLVRSDNPITDPYWSSTNAELGFHAGGVACVEAPTLGEPESVLVNGAAYEDWSYDDPTNTIVILNLSSSVVITWEQSSSGGGGGVIPSDSEDPDGEDGTDGDGEDGESEEEGPEDEGEGGEGSSDDGGDEGGSSGLPFDPIKFVGIDEIEDISGVVQIGLLVIVGVLIVSTVTGRLRRGRT